MASTDSSAVPAENWLQFPPSGCFGCSETNPSGLGLRFYRDGDRVRSDHVVASGFDGAPGVVHGGIQAAMLDEVMCAAVTFLDGRRVVTGELRLRYRRPCPSATPVAVSAWVLEREERFARVAGEIRDGEGALLTSAEGKFFYRPADAT